MNSELPKGTYVDESGQARYWDGQLWLTPKSKRSRKITKRLLIIIVSFMLALATVTTGLFVYNSEQARIEQIRRQAEIEESASKAFSARSIQVKSFLQKAVNACGVREGISVDQQRLSIDGKGNRDSSGAPLSGVYCLIYQLDMPDPIVSRWSSTTALQGVVEDEWNVLSGNAKLTARWTYHPANGPEMAFELNSIYFEIFDFAKHKTVLGY